jgi:HAMP domain-containing protein
MEQKINKVLGIALIIAIIALAVVLFFASKRIQKLQEIEDIYIITQDSLDVMINKYNQEVAKTEVLQSENTTLFTQLKIKDKDIIRLQKVILNSEKENKKINTALVISNETNIKLQDSIKSLIIGYSQYEGLDTASFILTEYPIYQREFKREWDSGILTLGRDTLSLDIKIRNDYDITIGDEKVNLFRKKLYANITNLNPNTQTKVMKVYQKKEVKTKDVQKAGIFTGIGILIGLLIN